MVSPRRLPEARGAWEATALCTTQRHTGSPLGPCLLAFSLGRPDSVSVAWFSVVSCFSGVFGISLTTRFGFWLVPLLLFHPLSL